MLFSPNIFSLKEWGAQIMTYNSSIQALRQLMLSKDKDIVKISAEDYVLSNGISYCCVGLISNKGTNYLIQAIGKEAKELHTEANAMVKNINS
jgi:hypothetical protein